MSQSVFLGKGCIYVGERNSAGKVISLTEIHTPKLEVQVESDIKERENTCNAISAIDVRVATKQTGKVMITTDEHNSKLLAIALGGEVTTNSAQTFTDKPFASGLIAGNIVPVPGGYANINTLALTDSAGTPASLSLGTHYTQDLDYGLITIVSVGSFTQPFKATGATLAAGETISIMTKNLVEKFIRFKGINIAANDAKCVLDIYRASFGPSKITPKDTGGDFQSLDFEGVLLSDPNADLDTTFGKFGKYILL